MMLARNANGGGSLSRAVRNLLGDLGVRSQEGRGQAPNRIQGPAHAESAGGEG
jgi:hypothetical protein